MLQETTYSSRFNPYSNPGIVLSPYIDGNETVIRCKDNQNKFNQGLFTEITDELRKYGSGEYTVKFDAKSVDGKDYQVQIWIHNVLYEGYKLIQKKPIETVKVNGEWQSYEAIFDLNDWNTADDSATIIRICSDDTEGYDVLFKNIEMTKTVPECRDDVNSDGVFNIADALMLQKWFLNVGGLNCWQNGDLCEDGVINVFDICVMKSMLIQKEK